MQERSYPSSSLLNSAHTKPPSRPLGAAPTIRPRRLRSTAALRASLSETRLDPRQLLLPVFVREGLSEPAAVDSMPGVVQHSRDSLRKAASQAARAGIGGLMIFGIPEQKDPLGSAALDPRGVLNQAIADVVAEVGSDLSVISELCLDEFTDHGHCGLLNPDGEVDNDATLDIYAQLACVQAESGAKFVAPSGMMDGQVAAIRYALDRAGHTETGVFAYAVKYASSLYAPFRDAIESSLVGDRRTYQLDPANGREGVREALLDVEQGADIVMIKPALPYLDVVHRVREAVDVPVAAYCISGEYSMVEAAATLGFIDRAAVIEELLLSIRRAGADLIATYWAVEAAEMLSR